MGGGTAVCLFTIWMKYLSYEYTVVLLILDIKGETRGIMQQDKPEEPD